MQCNRLQNQLIKICNHKLQNKLIEFVNYRLLEHHRWRSKEEEYCSLFSLKQQKE